MIILLALVLGMLSFMVMAAYIAYVGMPIIRFSIMLAKTKRRKLPLALMRVGRSIVPVELSLDTGSYFTGRFAGRDLRWRLTPGSIYDFLGARVVITSLNLAKTLEPHELDQVEFLNRPGVQATVFRHLKEKVLQRVDAYIEEQERYAEKLRAQLSSNARPELVDEYERELQATEHVLEMLGKIRRKVEETGGLVQLLRVVEGYPFLRSVVEEEAVGCGVDFDVIDPLSIVDPISLEAAVKERVTVEAGRVMGVKREAKAVRGNIFLLVFILAMMVLGMLFLAPMLTHMLGGAAAAAAGGAPHGQGVVRP